jgi:hypothetical protein
MRVFARILILVFLLPFPAYGIDFVIDGSLSNGGDCSALGGFWNGSSSPGVCEVLVFLLPRVDTLSVDHAELRLTYISINEGMTEIADEGVMNVVNGFGVTNRGQLFNHGLILSPDGTFNDPDSFIYNDGWINGGLTNNGVVVNVCPGLIDSPVTPNPALEAVTLGFDADSLVWCDNSASYDVLRGDLEVLHDTDGDFGPATLECLAENLGATSLDVDDPQQPGEGYWYLVRPASAVGIYDSGAPSQVGERDAEIEGSPLACQ